MNFQESLLPVFIGIIWQAGCWILAVFCVGERKSTSEFTGFGRKWIGICTTWSTKWTHKGIWMLCQSASPSQTSKGMSPGTRKKKNHLFCESTRNKLTNDLKKTPENLNGKHCKHPSSEIRSSLCSLRTLQRSNRLVRNHWVSSGI